jgi:hypothetical protein
MDLLPKTGGYGELGGVVDKVSSSEKWPVVARVDFNVSIGVSTTQQFSLPFAVDDPTMLEIDYQAATTSMAGGFIPTSRLVPTPAGGGVIQLIPNTADRSRDQSILYTKSTNQITFNTGAINSAAGVLSVKLRKRKLRNYAPLPSPADTNPADLPFKIKNIGNVYIGNESFSSCAKYLEGYLDLSAANSWHVPFLNGSNSGGAVKILSETTFKRDALALSSFYIMEFE